MQMHLGLLLASSAALCSSASAAAAVAAASKAQLDPFGTNGVRVRISAPGQPITEPITGALLDTAPSEVRHGPAAFDGPLSITHGNIKVVVDAATMLVTATRVSDGAVLLKQTNLSFVSATDAECNSPTCKKSPWLKTCACSDQLTGARPGSVQAKVTFQGTAGEMVYGLGEHKTRKVQQAPYTKTFADSLYYGMSSGGDVSIPYYSSSLGYGFAWNLPSLGDVSIGEDKIEWSSYATLGVDMWISTTPAGSAPEANAVVDPHRSFYLDLLHQWVDVSGHPTPMPFWTTGFIQCKDRYRNQSQVLSHWRHCQFADALSLSIAIETPTKGGGGCSRMTVSPTTAGARRRARLRDARAADLDDRHRLVPLERDGRLAAQPGVLARPQSDGGRAPGDGHRAHDHLLAVHRDERIDPLGRVPRQGIPGGEQRHITDAVTC